MPFMIGLFWPVAFFLVLFCGSECLLVAWCAGVGYPLLALKVDYLWGGDLCLYIGQ